MVSDRSNECAAATERTVDGLALRQVAVVLAGEQRIAVAAHHALDVAVHSVRKDLGATAQAMHTRI